jgi:lipopolysaccharide/colanic/teichoic acid biosynthesis glycosyltransferase
MNYSSFKRSCDVVFVMVAAIPTILVLMLWWPIGKLVFKKVLFHQTRIGLNEKPFVIWKLRTLLVDGDETSIPWIGRIARKTSLDELPQLWNVLKGEMSLVGPRPLLPEYLTYYNQTQRTRHQVLPGITGWAQVNGRNLQTWEERLQMDADYVKKQSFALDLKIIFVTILRLFDFVSTHRTTNESMPPFRGTKI